MAICHVSARAVQRSKGQNVVQVAAGGAAHRVPPRLTELAERPDTRTDDLIKIAGEIARTQPDIELLNVQQRGLQERVATEA